MRTPGGPRDCPVGERRERSGLTWSVSRRSLPRAAARDLRSDGAKGIPFVFPLIGDRSRLTGNRGRGEVAYSMASIVLGGKDGVARRAGCAHYRCVTGTWESDERTLRAGGCGSGLRGALRRSGE